ncbi:hypothetical protein [Nostoc sp. 'Lobaria pulmonaria (5183) cyanobiont']|uniref:hypothetical protein n=1 Tax=Nostoc sp. 'Lobaria pulmonaria (5183) cyanobiont' TaxID=1618022 RepID=UPI00131A2FFB|nr:hypothetical protein [Nostoc sp. 'Lobaria pulmonaria (5183) cyanobiont']
MVQSIEKRFDRISLVWLQRTGFASVRVVAETSDGFEVDVPALLGSNMRSLISQPQAYF